MTFSICLVSSEIGGWMKEWIGGWMKGWIGGCMKGWIGGWMDQWIIPPCDILTSPLE